MLPGQINRLKTDTETKAGKQKRIAEPEGGSFTKTFFCLGLFVSKNLKNVFVFNSQEDSCLTLGSFFPSKLF